MSVCGKSEVSYTVSVYSVFPSLFWTLVDTNSTDHLESRLSHNNQSPNTFRVFPSALIWKDTPLTQDPVDPGSVVAEVYTMVVDTNIHAATLLGTGFAEAGFPV